MMKLPTIPMSEFAERRERLLSKIAKDDVVVIAGSVLVRRGKDVALPFSQRPNFRYLCGVDEPDLVLVLSHEEQFLIRPPYNRDTEAWIRPYPDAKELATNLQLDMVYAEQEGWQRFKTLSALGSKVWTEPTPPFKDVVVERLYRHPADTIVRQKLAHYGVKAERQSDVTGILQDLRMIKSPNEIELISALVNITNQTLDDVAGQRAEYTNEHLVEAAINYGFQKRGADGHGFEPIVASGANAVSLHYVQNNQDIAADSLLLMDVGAGSGGYCADITRTIPMSDLLSSRAKDIYDAVEDMTDTLLKLFRPGMTIRELESSLTVACDAALINLGVLTKADIKKDPHTSRRIYNPAGLSHFLGLEVHDVGDYKRPFEPGVVLTCEPGLYIAEEGIGVRIEYDVLITEDGSRVL